MRYLQLCIIAMIIFAVSLAAVCQITKEVSTESKETSTKVPKSPITKDTAAKPIVKSVYKKDFRDKGISFEFEAKDIPATEDMSVPPLDRIVADLKIPEKDWIRKGVVRELTLKIFKNNKEIFKKLISVGNCFTTPEINAQPSYIIPLADSAIFNDKLYILANISNGNIGLCLFLFDFSNNKFLQIKIPRRPFRFGYGYDSFFARLVSTKSGVHVWIENGTDTDVYVVNKNDKFEMKMSTDPKWHTKKDK